MIKVAILGIGAIAETHIQAYLRQKDRCEVVALVDLYPDKAREKATKLGLKANIYRDYREAVEKEEFDAASICLPPFAHAEVAVHLLKAGKHVLVEKPMATCLQECDAMLAAASGSSRLLSIVAQNRFKTPMMKLKRILESGKIGRVLHGQVDSFWWRGASYYDLWWRGTWEKEGGGCTMNHAVHHIDLFQWMMGMPSELQAVILNLNHDNSEVEDFSTAVLRYPDGAVGQITASLVHHGEEQRLAFQGMGAKVAVPWSAKASRQKENGFPEEDPALSAELEELYRSLPEVPLEGHDGQIGNFLGAIAGKEPLLVDGNEGRKTLELITAIYQSGQSGEKVRLPLTTASPFYSRDSILQHAPRFHEKRRSIDNFQNDQIQLAGNYGR
jgi:UDP-N-acetyl-2-amino-2-deoxyglucuronate dehydrogenase